MYKRQDWVSEAKSLDSFTPLQLDTFHALWNLYDPSKERSRPQTPDKGAKRRPALARSEALRRFPIGTRVLRPLGGGKEGTGRPGKYMISTRRTGASALPTTIGRS